MTFVLPSIMFDLTRIHCLSSNKMLHPISYHEPYNYSFNCNKVTGKSCCGIINVIKTPTNEKTPKLVLNNEPFLIGRSIAFLPKHTIAFWTQLPCSCDLPSNGERPMRTEF